MQSPIRLSQEDYVLLQRLVRREAPGPKLAADQTLVLGARLSAAEPVFNLRDLTHHAGLHDTITLVSPTDPADRFTFKIVLPADENIDADLISAAKPISLAILGRRLDDVVSWNAPLGIRTMRIAGIHKTSSKVRLGQTS